MKAIETLRPGAAVFLTLLIAGVSTMAFAATTTQVVEKKARLESVRPDFDEGLGLSLEQKKKIIMIREEFRARQLAIKNALNAKYEALRQELDGDVPARSKVEPVVVEIKALQAQLTDNRVDVVFKLREIYTSKQIKLIKERSQQQRKAAAPKKQGKNVKKTLIKGK